MRKFALLVAALLAAPAAAAPPKLLVVISVDQFSSDLYDEYLPSFTGGLARLAGGVAYRNGYQSHAATETCPGHSTILSGDRPARARPRRNRPPCRCGFATGRTTDWR